MGKHTYKPQDFSTHPVANALEEALSDVLNKQSWFQERKNTLFAIAQMILQLGNVALFAVGTLPWYYALAIGIVISLAEAVTHSRTKGPVTPSGARAVADTYKKVITQHLPKQPEVPVFDLPLQAEDLNNAYQQFRRGQQG